MAFDPTVISGLRADRDGRDWRLSWQSSAPAGAIHQVYLDGRLAWSGPATRCTLPLGGVTAVQVGAVGAGESAADLATSAPAWRRRWPSRPRPARRKPRPAPITPARAS
jgi:hypothetical protein